MQRDHEEITMRWRLHDAHLRHDVREAVGAVGVIEHVGHVRGVHLASERGERGEERDQRRDHSNRTQLKRVRLIQTKMRFGVAAKSVQAQGSTDGGRIRMLRIGAG